MAWDDDKRKENEDKEGSLWRNNININKMKLNKEVGNLKKMVKWGCEL